MNAEQNVWRIIHVISISEGMTKSTEEGINVTVIYNLTQVNLYSLFYYEKMCFGHILF